MLWTYFSQFGKTTAGNIDNLGRAKNLFFWPLAGLNNEPGEALGSLL